MVKFVQIFLGGLAFFAQSVWAQDVNTGGEIYHDLKSTDWGDGVVTFLAGGENRSFEAVSEGTKTEARSDDFGNDDIVALVEASVGDQIILSLVASKPCVYNLSISAIIDLKKAGVSDQIIASLLERCSESQTGMGGEERQPELDVQQAQLDVPMEPGIYFRNDFRLPTHNFPAWAMLRQSDNVSSRWRGDGSVLFPFKLQLELPATAPQYSFSSDYVDFYLRLGSDTGPCGDLFRYGPPDLEEMGLARMEKKGGYRRILMDSSNESGRRLILDEKYSAPMTFNLIGRDLYQIDIKPKLTSGFYAFMVKCKNIGYGLFEFEVK